MIKLFQGFPYNNTYNYIKTFTNKTEQNNFFDTFDCLFINDDNYIKENENSFKVPYSYDYLVSLGINYINFNNGYKDIYAFIIEKQYVSEEVTRIVFDVDVIQTYLFDFTINKSFVERKNCSINEITDFDEGLELGEHQIVQTMTSIPKNYKYFAMFNGIKEQQLIFEGSNLVNVIPMPFTSNKPLTTIDGIQYPLHFMPLKELEEYAEPSFIVIDGGTGGSNGSNIEGSTGDWRSGVLSAKGFRFIKGFEGFAPKKYQDSGGYWTIAYGVTAHGEPSIYNELVAESPITEERGAKVSYDLKNKNYGAKIFKRCIDLGITEQYQFDALCSLAYNCGYGVVTGDNNLTRAIKENPKNESKIRGIWEKFYITSNGQTLNGLIARRKQECNMFFNKPFEVRKISKITSSGTYSGYVTENEGNGWLPS